MNNSLKETLYKAVRSVYKHPYYQLRISRAKTKQEIDCSNYSYRMRQPLLIAIVTVFLLSATGAKVVSRTERSTPNSNGSNGLVGACPTVINNTIVVPETPGQTGPPGPAGPPGPPGQDGLQGPVGNGGTIYTRWGRRDCPNTPQTSLIYEGIAAGSFYNQGGGVNFLCLPRDPEFLRYTSGQQQWRAKLHGAEYEGFLPMPAFNNIHDHNVPCAICYTPARGTKLMIPAKINCPSSWTREYYGYLMSHASRHPQRNTFECVDVNSVPLPGTARNTNGAVFYFTETTCNGIPCGPYQDGKEISCVVCTK